MKRLNWQSSRRPVDEEAQLTKLAESSRRRGGSISRAHGEQSTKRLYWQSSRRVVDEEEALLAELTESSRRRGSIGRARGGRRARREAQSAEAQLRARGEPSTTGRFEEV